MTNLIPNAIEAEKSILSIIICDPSSHDDIFSILKPSDFYSQDHQEIFEIMCKLRDNSKPVDVISVTTDNKQYLSYLVELSSCSYSFNNPKYYCGLIKAKSIRREVIDKAKQVIQISQTGEFDNLNTYLADVMQVMDLEIKTSQQNKVTINDIVKATIENIEGRQGKELQGITYGYRWLDRMTSGAKAGELILIAARPSVGKTTLLVNMLKRMSVNLDIAFFSLEMGNDQIAEKMLTIEANIDGQAIKSNVDAFVMKKIKNAGERISKLKLEFYDTVNVLEEIRAICRKKKKKGLDLIAIDYLQIMETTAKCGNSYERVSYLSRKLKALAKELQVPLIALSQLKRPEGENIPPKLSDLRESGSLEQDADVVMLLHDESYGDSTTEGLPKKEIRLHLAKNRTGMRDCITKLDYDTPTQLISEREYKKPESEYQQVKNFWEGV